mmetsp:Transcript_84344/g.236189  ORF Transcript_84344/g.236189 Transcript_84344/m.236189 type:complete len:120 (-) Transcript_84344:103-462(-)
MPEDEESKVVRRRAAVNRRDVKVIGLLVHLVLTQLQILYQPPWKEKHRQAVGIFFKGIPSAEESQETTIFLDSSFLSLAPAQLKEVHEKMSVFLLTSHSFEENGCSLNLKGSKAHLMDT